jgi:ParB family chromosome partitioning protein
LDALIPVDEVQPSGEVIQQIAINQIKPNPHQPRTEINPDELAELAASIREHGILQPLTVSPGSNPREFILVAGERRLRAAELAGLATVPAILRSVTELQQLELALIENIQRADLSPLETAGAYQQLIDQFHLTHEEVADKVGKNRVTVTNTIRLLKLPDAAQEALRKNLISEGHARAILGLNTSQAQLAALQTVITKALNVRQTEELVKRLSGHREITPVKPVYSAQIKEIEENLRDILGTKVTVHYSPKGGSVVIHYYSDEELTSIVDKISKHP